MVSRNGVEALLGLWAQSREKHPYMFFMGTDFRKIKAPFIWYDIVHVADVLSRFPWLQNDERLREMAYHLRAKANDDGSYIPQSEWKAWSGWDFAQKKTPSP